MFIVLHKTNNEWKPGNVIHENIAWALDEVQFHIYKGREAKIYQLKEI